MVALSVREQLDDRCHIADLEDFSLVDAVRMHLRIPGPYSGSQIEQVIVQSGLHYKTEYRPGAQQQGLIRTGDRSVSH